MAAENHDVVLRVERLTKRYVLGVPLLARLVARERHRIVHAVEDVSFEIARGTTFALVGESGCGKSTIARCIAGILPPTSGSIHFIGADIARLRTRSAALPYRRNLQMIFQDPYASLNPRWSVARIIAEPIVTHRLLPSHAAIDARVVDLLRRVGLSATDRRKYPHQFSGGQRQRISIARALASEPAFLVCDEPTSALDVSVQAQILNLMRRLQQQLGLTYLLISHNFAVVAHMADRIGVMYLGRIVESGDTASVLDAPRHPYTRMLVAAVPDIDKPAGGRQALKGEVPSPLSPPSGCAFHPRCPLANERCRRELPALVKSGDAYVACHAIQEGRTESRPEAGVKKSLV
jgi:peptide/nickel transport system ATP-binding protein